MGLAAMDASSIDLTNLNWIPDIDLSNSARPVTSFTAIVGGDVETGRVDFFTRWEPNSYCSFHRHLAETISVVVAGELHVEETDGSKTTRAPGHYSCTPAGRLHWEHAGPKGALVFYTLQSKDGPAFEVSDRNGNPIQVVTVADMLTGSVLLAR